MTIDEELADYINKFYMESMIGQAEVQLLYFLRRRQEKFPSEKNDREWLEFADWVCKRNKS